MKAFIFDLDGTLLDTLADIAAACNHVLDLNGYPQHPLPAYKTMVGRGFENLLAQALPPDENPAPSLLLNLVKQTRDWYAAHMMERTAPYPAMEDALERLWQNGARLAVLSNKPDKLTKELVIHYFPSVHFIRIQGACQELPLKPDPTSLLEIMGLCRTSPEETCYVGDSDVDMFTARNAGVAGVGASWGFRGSVELAGAGAWKILDTPSQLPGLYS